MIILKQEDTDIYINSNQIKNISLNKKNKEARVLYNDGQEIRYFKVESIDFNDKNL